MTTQKKNVKAVVVKMKLIEHELVGQHVCVGGIYGQCTGAKLSTKYIINRNRAKWSGVQFRIKPAINNEKEFWTKPYKHQPLNDIARKQDETKTNHVADTE